MRTREGEREREREREREIERGRESEREGEGEGERGDVAAKSELTSKIGCWVIPPLKQTSAEKNPDIVGHQNLKETRQSNADQC